MKICLVVDDSSVIRKVARRILEGLDFQIVEAEDGGAGVAAASDIKPDLILMDIQLPVIDGYEATRRIKRMVPSVAVVVASYVFCTVPVSDTVSGAVVIEPTLPVALALNE